MVRAAFKQNCMRPVLLWVGTGLHDKSPHPFHKVLFLSQSTSSVYYHDMQNAKENAIKAIEKLPDESTYEDIMERLLNLKDYL